MVIDSQDGHALPSRLLNATWGAAFLRIKHGIELSFIQWLIQKIGMITIEQRLVGGNLIAKYRQLSLIMQANLFEQRHHIVLGIIINDNPIPIIAALFKRLKYAR